MEERKKVGEGGEEGEERVTRQAGERNKWEEERLLDLRLCRPISSALTARSGTHAVQPGRDPRSFLRNPQSPSPPPFSQCRASSLPFHKHQSIFFFLQRDIRYLDFAALRDAGYRGAIFDKDNCLVPVFSHPLSVRTHTTFRLFQMMTSSFRS